MKPRATFYFIFALNCYPWLDVNTQAVKLEKEEGRTALPLLLLLSNPLALPLGATGGLLPGVPIRRPHDEQMITRDPPSAQLSQLSSDVPQRDETVATDSNAQIREQFIQGLLQGLQSMGTATGPTVQPAVLADFLQQVMAAQTTTMPSIQKEAKRPLNDESNNDNDPDYDYIDFKNGSRIKYELDNDQQLTDSHYANKTQQQSAFAVAPLTYVYYRPQWYG